MRAVTMRHGHLELKDIPEPPMTDDHLLVEPLSAGVCGGDLNAMDHADDFLHTFAAPAARRCSCSTPTAIWCSGTSSPHASREVGAHVEGYAPGDVLLVSPAVRRSGRRRALRRVRQRLSRRARRAGRGVALRSREDPRGRLALRRRRRRPGGHRPQRRVAIQDRTARRRDGHRVRAGGSRRGGRARSSAASTRSWRPTRRPHAGAIAARSFGAHVVVDPAEDDPVAAWRDLAERRPASVRVRGVGQARHARLAALHGAVVHPHHRGRRVHGRRPDPADRRHLQERHHRVLRRAWVPTARSTRSRRRSSAWPTAASTSSSSSPGTPGSRASTRCSPTCGPGNYRDIDHMKILVRHDIDGPGIHAPR